jgi:formate/nitrite transporter
VVFFGNLCGSLGGVFLIYLSGHWLMGNGAVGAQAVMIANSKVNLGFMQAFSSGILCNALVCLAVWLCFASHTVTDKILAIIFPITAFVTLGFEHSVANMYFIPAGMLAKTNQEVMKIVGDSLNLSNLNLVGFIYNLVPVTLGNIIGGSVFVGMIYWFIYLRN